MSKRRRDIEAFSMSFLDCICCGFGAIILLFVLSKSAQPQLLEISKIDLTALVKKLDEQLHEIRGETTILNRELAGKREQLSEAKEKVARLQGDLSHIEGEFAASNGDASLQNELEGTLATAKQSLTAEMRRLLANLPEEKKSNAVGGIPVDSEYIVFIIDTSGMKDNAWPMVMAKCAKRRPLPQGKRHTDHE